mmetsp:Transcript_107008/g.340856  ORF Transcript_107008/g.340856 Transcript_107008/m.340856 type:complete len:430 (-) Transcript_107008:208-1497(-)
MRPGVLAKPAVVDLEEAGAGAVSVLRAHKAELHVPDAPDVQPDVHVRVAPDVRGGPHALELLLQLQAPAGHRWSTTARQVVSRQEVAKAHSLTLAAPLLLLRLDAFYKVVVPLQEPLVSHLVTHGPLAKGIIDVTVRLVVAIDEGATPPRQERHHVDVLHDLCGHHLRPDVLAHLQHGQELLDGVPELLFVRVVGVWPDPHVVVTRHVEYPPELLLEDLQAILHGVEGVRQVACDQENVVLVLCGRHALGPLHDIGAVVDVDVGDRKYSSEVLRPMCILRESLQALPCQRRLQARDLPERPHALLHGLVVASLKSRRREVSPVGFLCFALPKVGTANAEEGLEPPGRGLLGGFPVRERVVPVPELRKGRGAVGGVDRQSLLQVLVAVGAGRDDRERRGVVGDGEGQIARFERRIPVRLDLLCLGSTTAG